VSQNGSLTGLPSTEEQTMDNRLYVTNLSASASLASLRSCFAACGEVSDIEFAVERHAPRAASSAFVTMACSADAEKAIRRLNGISLDGRSLMVTLLPGKANSGQRSEKGEGRRGAAATPPTIAITQQYRERHNMTYELDCEGARLILRMFFPPDGASGAWRIEARCGGNGEVVEKSAATRELALKEIAEAWQALVSSDSLQTFDWVAVTRALQGVRAI
jgi:RNA recognition motif-containing protein